MERAELEALEIAMAAGEEEARELAMTSWEEEDQEEPEEDESDPFEWDEEAQTPEKLSFMETKYQKTDNKFQSLWVILGIVLFIIFCVSLWQPDDHSMDRRAGETNAEYQARIDRAEAAGPEQDLSEGSHSWE